MTTGLLLTASGMPRLAGVVPALWAVIASSAALTLGIWADSMLLACAALLMVDMLAPDALGASAGED